MRTYCDAMRDAGLVTAQELLTWDTQALWVKWSSLSDTERWWVWRGWLPATYMRDVIDA